MYWMESACARTIRFASSGCSSRDVYKRQTMTEACGKYAGMERYAARKAIVKDLEEQGYLIKVEDHAHNVGTCYRCGTTVEPMVSKQWFVKMEPLAKPAIDVVRDGQIKLIPERMNKTYFNWMENIKDWCISRQLWWGHRIPAYYCEDCGEVIVAKEEMCIRDRQSTGFIAGRKGRDRTGRPV